MTDSAEIQNIKKLITDTSGERDRINKKLDDHISGEKIQKDIVKTLRIQQLQDCLNRLLQKEVNRLVHQESHCKTLCACKSNSIFVTVSPLFIIFEKLRF